MDLAVDGGEATVSEDRRRVVEVSVTLGKADNGDDSGGLLGKALHGLARVAQEVLLVEQILGWIARDRELTERDELGASVTGTGDRVRDRSLVRRDIADRRVGLAERQAEHGKGAHRPIIAERPAGFGHDGPATGPVGHPRRVT